MDREALVRPGGAADRATRWIAVFGFTALMVVAIITMADVLLRWLFSAPLEGLEDINRFVFAVAIASCLPAGLLQGHNITIRFLGSALGRGAALRLEAVGAVATLLFFGLIVWRFAVFAHDESVHGRHTLTLGMPTAPWWWLVVVLLAAAVAVQLLIVAASIGRSFSRSGADSQAPSDGSGT